MITLVLLRHGESTWNKENRFTGWTDVDLSDRGREEASAAGRLLREGGYAFDAIRAAHRSPELAALVLVLVLLGAGSKAGVVPLHVWLPLAHAATPIHVSNLMMFIMKKVAVDNYIRFRLYLHHQKKR